MLRCKIQIYVNQMFEKRESTTWQRVVYLLINFGSLTESKFQVSSFQTHKVSPQRPFWYSGPIKWLCQECVLLFTFILSSTKWLYFANGHVRKGGGFMRFMHFYLSLPTKMFLNFHKPRDASTYKSQSRIDDLVKHLALLATIVHICTYWNSLLAAIVSCKYL